jgi:hypothetical protein
MLLCCMQGIFLQVFFIVPDNSFCKGMVVILCPSSSHFQVNKFDLRDAVILLNVLRLRNFLIADIDYKVSQVLWLFTVITV